MHKLMSAGSHLRTAQAPVFWRSLSFWEVTSEPLNVTDWSTTWAKAWISHHKFILICFQSLSNPTGRNTWEGWARKLNKAGKPLSVFKHRHKRQTVLVRINRQGSRQFLFFFLMSTVRPTTLHRLKPELLPKLERAEAETNISRDAYGRAAWKGKLSLQQTEKRSEKSPLPQ